ncbi:MAG: hypothetical protein P8126_01460 [Gammaproteobacteria bacterium]|jgi:hypothetical protein
MNEDHVIAAILAAGLIARGSKENLDPASAVQTYELVLTELLAATRGRRAEEGSA